MKKILITLLTAALLLALPINALADDTDRVVDLGNMLSEEQESALEDKLNGIADKYSFDAVALTVGNYVVDSETAAVSFADDYYDENGYSSDGCLLLITEDHYWHISTKGYGIIAITDYGVKVLEQEVIKPYFGNEDWNGGFNAYADFVEEFVSQAKSGSAYDIENTYTNTEGHTYTEKEINGKGGALSEFSGGAALISLVVAAIIAAVIAIIVKGNYKPVRFKASAADYLVDGSLHLTDEYDRFLFSNVTKTKIESDSSSKGGSSTHTSSSGSTHGGGGGRF